MCGSGIRKNNSLELSATVLPDPLLISTCNILGFSRIAENPYVLDCRPADRLRPHKGPSPWRKLETVVQSLSSGFSAATLFPMKCGLVRAGGGRLRQWPPYAFIIFGYNAIRGDDPNCAGIVYRFERENFISGCYRGGAIN